MEAVKPVQLKICQTNNYRKDFSWLHFDDEPRNHKGQKVKDQQFDISIFVVYQTSPNRTNKSSNFLRGSFSSRDNVRAQTQFTRERQPQHLKRWRTDPHIFISIHKCYKTCQTKQADYCPSPQCVVDQIQV